MNINIDDNERMQLIEAITTSNLPIKRSLIRVYNLLKNVK